MDSNKISGFNIDLYTKDKDGNKIFVGKQNVSILDEHSDSARIGVGADSENEFPLFNIVFEYNSETGKPEKHLVVNKLHTNFKKFKFLEKYATNADEHTFILDVDKVVMSSNDDISFTLLNKPEEGKKQLKSVSIKSNSVEIVDENNNKKTVQTEIMNVVLPSNFIELSMWETPMMQINSLPSQAFGALEELAKQNNHVKTAKYKVGNSENEQLKIAKVGEKLFVAIGTQLTEINGNFIILPELDSKNEKTGKFDLVIGINKRDSQNYGNYKKSRLVKSISPEMANEIEKFVKQNSSTDQDMVVREDENSYISKQINEIKKLRSSDKTRFVTIDDGVVQEEHQDEHQEEHQDEDKEKPKKEMEKEEKKEEKKEKKEGKKEGKKSLFPIGKNVKLSKYIPTGIALLASILLIAFAPFLSISIFFPITFGALSAVANSVNIGKMAAEDIKTIKERKAKIKNKKTKKTEEEKDKNKDKDKENEQTEKNEEQIKQEKINKEFSKKLQAVNNLIRQIDDYAIINKNVKSQATQNKIIELKEIKEQLKKNVNQFKLSKRDEKALKDFSDKSKPLGNKALSLLVNRIKQKSNRNGFEL